MTKTKNAPAKKTAVKTAPAVKAKITNKSLVLKYVSAGITDPGKITNMIVGKHKRSTSVPSVRWYFYNDAEVAAAFKKAKK